MVSDWVSELCDRKIENWKTEAKHFAFRNGIIFLACKQILHPAHKRRKIIGRQSKETHSKQQSCKLNEIWISISISNRNCYQVTPSAIINSQFCELERWRCGNNENYFADFLLYCKRIRIILLLNTLGRKFSWKTFFRFYFIWFFSFNCVHNS